MSNHFERPFFSIVVPTYNVAPFIALALGDIMGQTFRDFEVIIVNDAASDGSEQIAQLFVEADSRFSMLHHPTNLGLSSARNTGIGQACGKYIWICDPDDRYDENLLESVHAAIVENGSDLVMFGHVTKSRFGSKVNALQSADFREAQQFRPEVIYLEQSTHLGYVWNKVYSLSKIKQNNLQFRDNADLIEDILFNIEFLNHIDSMSILESAPYHYMVRFESSLTNKFVSNYFELHECRILVLREMLKFWGVLDLEAEEILGALYGRYVISAMTRNCDPAASMTAEDRVHWIENLFDRPRYNELMLHAKAKSSLVLTVCLLALKSKSPYISMLLARLIYLVKKVALPVYQQIKSAR
jgi:glycosyltransferase involved in cell wall biosynthesis